MGSALAGHSHHWSAGTWARTCATCSPHPAETLAVVAEVLGRRDDVVQEDAWPLFRDAFDEPIERVGDLPSVQLWPHLHGTDGMFLSLLRKKA